MTDANANANAAHTPSEADARWSRMAACSCNFGCNVCDPPPADWYAVEIVNGPRATGTATTGQIETQ